VSLPEFAIPSTQSLKPFELARLSTWVTNAFDLTKQFSTTPLIDIWRDVERQTSSISLVKKSPVRRTYVADIAIIAKVEETDEAKLAAANRLLEGIYKKPIAHRRWQAHRARLQRAIQERAEILKTSKSKALHQAAQEALFTVCAELKLPQSRLCVVIDKRRFYVRDLTPWTDLSASHFRDHVKNRLSNELMDILVPDWRKCETKDVIGKNPQFVTIDDMETTANLESYGGSVKDKWF
jgi:hypothetical protein